MKRLYIFRHGETDWNAQNRFQGHLNIPLNEKGREQALGLAPLLSREKIEAILSSDLDRAYETASIVARTLQVPVFKDPGLREAHLGEAQGLTYSEVLEKFGQTAVRWRSYDATDADVSYPGGETGVAVLSRTMGAIHRFFEERSFSRIGIACHGGVIRRLMQNVLPAGSDPVPIPNAVLYVLEYHLNEKRLVLAPGQLSTKEEER